MDRGFTVEGLTVTYMPRGKGVGNADTIQQRARFFGYKGCYASLCRAWPETDVADAFTRYVEHEESMRKELAGEIGSGESLRTWRRRFLLDKGMKPTRAAVVRLQLQHAVFGDAWWRQSVIVTNDMVLRRSNSALLASTLADHSWNLDQTDWQFQQLIRRLTCPTSLNCWPTTAVMTMMPPWSPSVSFSSGSSMKAETKAFLVRMQPPLRKRNRKGDNVNNLFEGTVQTVDIRATRAFMLPML